MIARFLAAAAFALLLAGCSGEETGPERIVWDRDIGEMCRMAISDPRFVAEVRGGPKHRLYKFDDVGGAVAWLADQPWADDPKTELWVAEVTSTRERVVWLDGRKAFYLAGQRTPMDYGFAAVAEARSGALTFAEMKAATLRKAEEQKAAHLRGVPGVAPAAGPRVEAGQ
jgi:nitrous oxide reductase accessory protein NosL